MQRFGFNAQRADTLTDIIRAVAALLLDRRICMKNDKPDGYYDEIKYSFEKKNDIKAGLHEYEIIEHTNNEEDYEYLENDDVPSEQNSDEYSYPRRYGVRFIMKNGKCFGSASMKKYDDETAYISYVYIEEVDNADELSVSVIKHLEEDAKKAGMSRIFTNIEISEESLYTSLGYVETDRIDDGKVLQLNGAKVIFDKTMSKRL